MSDSRLSISKPLVLRSRRRHYVAFVINAIFFAFVFYWLSQNINLSALKRHLQQIPASTIIVAMAMNIAVLICFGARLAAILCAKIPACFLISITGMTFNSLLPFRLGEGIKIYCGRAFFGLPLGGLGAAILMEKLYDLSMLLCLFAIVTATARLPFVDFSSPQILGLAIAVPLCVLLVIRSHASGKWPSGQAIFERFGIDGLFEQAKTLFLTQRVASPVFLTMLIWSTNVSLVLFLFRAILPEIHIGPLEAMTLVVIGSLAIAVPLSPAGLGVFEAGIAAYLINMHGVQIEKAISTATVYHFVILAPHSAITALLLSGMFFLSKLSEPLVLRKILSPEIDSNQ